MKKIYTIAALAAASLAMVSCSDFLDQTSPSEHSTTNTFESPYYTGLTVNKAYGLLTQDRTYSQDMAIIWGMNTDVELVDGLGTARNDAGARKSMNYDTSASESSMKFDEAWTAGYEIVEYCNEIEEGIRQSETYKSAKGTDKAEFDQYLGEVITLRAMVYLDMIRFWGDIPMKFESAKSDLSNITVGKTDRDVILDSLMVQLKKEPIQKLPWAGSGLTTEHVTQGYARALYAQIALTRAGYAIREASKAGYETAEYSDATYPTQRPAQETREKLYREAALQLDTVISKGIHKLNPSYENEFYLLNQQTLDKTYYENIFEIPMMHNVSGELGYTVGKRMNGDTSDFGRGNSSGKLKTTAELLYSYAKGDTRRDVTCTLSQFKESNEKTTEEISAAPFAIYIGKWRPEWMSAEWTSQNMAMKGSNSKHMTGINVVKMRYSQVLLMYAECLNELVGYNSTLAGTTCGMTALQALMEVHNRAFGTEQTAYENSINSDDELFEAINNENKWEFVGENVRKWDLIRWGLLAKEIAKSKNDYVNDCVNAGWPTTIYYKYTDDKKTRIDASSYLLTADDIASATLTGYESKTGFGFESEEKRNDSKEYKTNLPGISSGLVGTNATSAEIGEPVGHTVKNRYIMPIGTKTLSDANGALQNSYGY